MEPYRGPTGEPTRLVDTIFSTIPGSPAYVSKASLVALNDERGERDEPAQRMSRGEALEVLGLEPGADEDEIRSAHKRLLRLVHPDGGGSAYLARRVYQARDTLLNRAGTSRIEAGDNGRA